MPASSVSLITASGWRMMLGVIRQFPRRQARVNDWAKPYDGVIPLVDDIDEAIGQR